MKESEVIPESPKRDSFALDSGTKDAAVNSGEAVLESDMDWYCACGMLPLADETLARYSMEQFAPLPTLCTECARVGW
jgi:hypothetical protein